MSQKGFRYDMNKCLECRACVVSCKDKNDLPVGVNFNSIEERERGKFPDVYVWFTLKMCRHCSKPACVEKCPTGAMTKDDDTGMVYVKEDVCCTLIPVHYLGRLAQVPTPLTDAVITITQILSHENFYATGRNLSRLGWEGLSCEQIKERIS